MARASTGGDPPGAPHGSEEPTEQAGPGTHGDAAESRVADREVLLFLHEDDLPQLESPASVIDAAVGRVLERLDPLEQQGSVDDPLSGRRLLPGVVPLAPISLGAFFTNCAALLCATLFSLQYAPAYLLAFSVFHALFFGHLWTYYVAYRTRRRFLGFRQVLFIVALVAFVDWMMLDLIAHPPAVAQARARLGSTYETYLWAGVALNGLAAGLVLVHWAILGRGYHEAPAPRPKGRNKPPPTTTSTTDAPVLEDERR